MHRTCSGTYDEFVVTYAEMTEPVRVVRSLTPNIPKEVSPCISRPGPQY